MKCPSLASSRAAQASRIQTTLFRTHAVAPASPSSPLKPPSQGPIILDGQILHSIEPHRLEIVNSMEQDGWVEQELTKMLKPVEKCWQPADYLPDASDPDFLDKVRELRLRTSELPDDYLVALVGDMITEEALPTYMSMLNTLDGVRDETGASSSPWAKWTRMWTAEENRHGDLLNKYLYLTGRVNMRAVEVTIQNLIGSGMVPKLENNPYLCFVYTSFQERATKISHGHTALQAGEYGDDVLRNVAGAIASDESRHEIAYTKIVDELFVRDPDGAMLSFAGALFASLKEVNTSPLFSFLLFLLERMPRPWFACRQTGTADLSDMMKKQIVMPAHLMHDLEHTDKNDGRNLFADFSDVAQRLGVYTASDYADIMEHLIVRWQVRERQGLSGEAAAAQEYLSKLPARIRKLSERSMARRKKAPVQTSKFSWVYDRPVQLF